MHLFVKTAFDDSDICHRANRRRLREVCSLLKSLTAQLSLPPTTANITLVYSFCVCVETGLIYCMLKYSRGAFLCWIPSKFLQRRNLLTSISLHLQHSNSERPLCWRRSDVMWLETVAEIHSYLGSEDSAAFNAPHKWSRTSILTFFTPLPPDLN